MTKEEKLKYIFNAIKKAYPNKKLVFNDGSPDMPVMIIGEAPGKDEEIQGKPFVGRAGKLLNATLEKLGWKRSDFYVTNIVRYRPQDGMGGTLTPTPEEIEKFRLALEKEIDVVGPKLIVVLGRIAMTGLGIEGSMSSNRGNIIDKKIGEVERKILIVYHPAAILRNMNWEPIFREDLAKIRELI
ncbi:MAG: uracil-DNA glycosylase [Candidatus Yanofskybacteria bacterium]|nr:uracil-DNA glycosylase [Candidatus Yanofskybacteria bacterium]